MKTGSTKAMFYTNEEFKSSSGKIAFPCFVFIKMKWDDFGFRTEYQVNYYENSRKKIELGTTKIFSKRQIITEIPRSFSALETDYCSLGQSNYYYSVLGNEIDQEVREMYLDAVNDVVFNKGLLDEFEHEEGFKTSLIRTSEAQKALREGFRLLSRITIRNVFKFTFSCQIGNASKQHSITFDFSEKRHLPNRINVIIGKNGTGKTQFISRLASTLSGLESNGTFSTKYLPPFSRVLAISYSLFDRFPKPVHTKTFSYHYCGFQGNKGFLTELQSKTRITNALTILEQADRLQLYGNYLATILSEDVASEILDEEFLQFSSKSFSFYDNKGYSKYSSGQIMIILVLAEIMAYIRDESILIFDEPETHLHPNSISLFMTVINKLLKRYNSYAIIATHSPQIIQEVPSVCIKVIERIDDAPFVRGVGAETFGENLNTITEKIFQTISNDEFYRTYLTQLSKTENYESILENFEKYSQPLSLNAKIFLQSLYTEDEKSNPLSKKN